MMKYIVILVVATVFSAIYTPIDNKLKNRLSDKKIWLRYVISIIVGGVYFFATYMLLGYLLPLIGITDVI